MIVALRTRHRYARDHVWSNQLDLVYEKYRRKRLVNPAARLVKYGIPGFNRELYHGPPRGRDYEGSGYLRVCGVDVVPRGVELFVSIEFLVAKKTTPLSARRRALGTESAIEAMLTSQKMKDRCEVAT